MNTTGLTNSLKNFIKAEGNLGMDIDKTEKQLKHIETLNMIVILYWQNAYLLYLLIKLNGDKIWEDYVYMVSNKIPALIVVS